VDLQHPSFAALAIELAPEAAAKEALSKATMLSSTWV
jgi:hypothetical protein